MPSMLAMSSAPQALVAVNALLRMIFMLPRGCRASQEAVEPCRLGWLAPFATGGPESRRTRRGQATSCPRLAGGGCRIEQDYRVVQTDLARHPYLRIHPE